jgi:hypothetical protein
MKRKEIVKNKRALARLVADLDGKYIGLNHKDIEKAFALLVAIEVAARLRNYKSPLVMLKGKAISKANVLKKRLQK